MFTARHVKDRKERRDPVEIGSGELHCGHVPDSELATRRVLSSKLDLPPRTVDADDIESRVPQSARDRDAGAAP